MKMSQEQDFKKKREQFSINVRKNNRQNLLMKRRKIEDFPEPQANPTSSQPQKQKYIVVDPCLKTYLLEMLSQKYEAEQLKSLISLMDSTDILQKHRAVIGLRYLSARHDEDMIHCMLDRKIIDKLVQWYRQEEYLQIRLESLWVFTNLSSYSREVTARLVEQQVLPILGKDLMNKCEPIQEQAIWATGNISADHPKYRDQLISLQAIPKVLTYLQKNRSNKQIVTAVWVLSNLARGQPPPKYDSVKHVIPAIAQALKTGIINNEEIISDCLWTLANLSEGPKIRLARIRETGVIASVTKFLQHPNLSLSIPVLRLIGNFTTGTTQDTNQVLRLNLLDEALLLLDSKKSLILKQTCWTISNITAGTDEQILQFLQRQDLIEKLLTIYPSQPAQIKTQIIWIFTNLQKCSISEIALNIFETIKIMPMIGEQLKQKNQKCLIDGLVCLYRVLALGERCARQEGDTNRMVLEFIQLGYGPVLENLQGHESQKILRECHKIMQRFFEIQEEPMEDV